MTPIEAGSRPGVVVVADDLSGAADAAVRFLHAGEEIVLVSLAGEARRLPAAHAAVAAAGRVPEAATASVAIDTGTRGGSEHDSVLALQETAVLVRERRPALVYKKIDSQLRGRPGLEIETLRRELRLRCALVAPALPDQDRVTRAGVHLVRGRPAAESEAGRDPVAPVTESRLPALVAQQAGVPVAHVAASDLAAGPAGLRRLIERHVDEGHPIVTFDASTRGDLELIAEVACGFPDALLAGSAGLAGAVAARRATAAAEPVLVPYCESMLLVCGSTSGALRRQVAALSASGRARAVTLTPSAVAGPGRDDLVAAALEQWAKGDLALVAPAERVEGPTGATAVAAALADLALALVARRRPEGLFLSGGDTAAAVLRAARVTAVRLRGEVAPGSPWGLAAGGPLDGLTVITRAGGFGGDEDLVELHRRCQEGTTHD